MSVSTFRHLMDYSSPSTEQKTKELNVQREMYSSAAAGQFALLMFHSFIHNFECCL